MWHPWGMQRSEWQKNERCQQWKEVSYFYTHPCVAHVIPTWCACDTYVICMCYPCDIHEACRDLSGRRMRDVNNEKKWVIVHTPMYCACNTYVICMCYPCGIHEACRDLSGRRMRDVNNEKKWVIVHTPMYCACNTYVICMCYPCGIHEACRDLNGRRMRDVNNEKKWVILHTPMCCTCDTHMVCMWYLCNLHVLPMWHPCGIHEACRDLSGRRMRDVNNENKWVILHTPMCCTCDAHMVCMWIDVICMCYPCDIHEACWDLSGRRMRDVNNEMKWVILHTPMCCTCDTTWCACE